MANAEDQGGRPDAQSPAFVTAQSPGEAMARLREEAQACTRCPLYQHATQAVCGEGALPARLMIIGEQPGNQEDMYGKPFVGPAGQILREAMDEAGVRPDEVFITNAVKHFKNEPRGKKRLHKRPTDYEVERCRLWLDREINIIRPRLILTLGATALRSLLGRRAAVRDLRGSRFELENGRAAMATIHPSYLLRLPNRAEAKEERGKLISDIAAAAAFVREG